MKAIHTILLALFLYEIIWVVATEQMAAARKAWKQEGEIAGEHLEYWLGIMATVLLIVALILATKSFWLLLPYTIFAALYYGAMRGNISIKAYRNECFVQALVFLVAFGMEM